jgi:hypothetical protein
MKAFISIPMRGRDETEIRKDQNEWFENLKEDFKSQKRDEDLKLIETINKPNAPENASRLWYLGESIKLLGEADVVFFPYGWWTATGCWVEFFAANLYEKEVIFDYKDEAMRMGLENAMRLIGLSVGPKRKEESK